MLLQFSSELFNFFFGSHKMSIYLFQLQRYKIFLMTTLCGQKSFSNVLHQSLSSLNHNLKRERRHGVLEELQYRTLQQYTETEIAPI